MDSTSFSSYGFSLYYFCAPLTSSSPLRGVVDLYPWRVSLVRFIPCFRCFFFLLSVVCNSVIRPLLLFVVLYLTHPPPPTYRLGRIGRSSRNAAVHAPGCVGYPLTDDDFRSFIFAGCVSTTHPIPIHSHSFIRRTHTHSSLFYI